MQLSTHVQRGGDSFKCSIHIDDLTTNTFIRIKFLLHSPQRKPWDLLIFFSVYDHKHRALKVYGCNNRCLDPIGIGPFITPTWVALKIKSLVWFFAPDWRSHIKVIMIGDGLNINNHMCRWGPRYQSISCKAITTKTPPQLLFYVHHQANDRFVVNKILKS